MEHSITCKVYYEDTDSLGVVYYANYLKYLERGRSEWVAQIGKDIAQWNREGANFVVSELHVKFKKPAVLWDMLTVLSQMELLSPYRGLFRQRIMRADTLLLVAEVELACLDAQMRLRQFPPEFQHLLTL